MSKNYLNRSNAEYDPIGDPLGGDPKFSRIRKFNDPVTAVIAGGASLLGSAMSGSAAKSAAQTQADAATRASELQQQTAMAGIPILQNAYGQGQNYVNQGYGQGTGALNQYYGQGTQAVLGQEQPQQNYLNNLYNAQYGTQFGLYGQNINALQPYQQAGSAAATQLQDLIPSLSRQFTSQDLNSYLAPNYQFMLNQGLGATNQALNVAGGGSNMVNAANIFAQNYAGNAYQNAFNNYQTQQNNIYNRLAGIAGLGTTANQQNIQAGGQFGNALSSMFGTLAPTTTNLATTTGTNLAGLAQNTGTNLANLAGQYGQQSAGLATGLGANTVGLTTGAAQAGAGGITGAANAQAAGQIGAGNAVAGGLTNAGNNYLLSQLLAPKTTMASPVGGYNSGYDAAMGANFTAPNTYG